MNALAFTRPPQALSSGAQRRGQEGTIPLAPNHYGEAEWLRGTPKNPNNIASTLFNTLHLLPKYLRFEHGGAKLLAPGAI